MGKRIIKPLLFVLLLAMLVAAVLMFPHSTRLRDMLEEHKPSAGSNTLTIEAMSEKLCFGLPIVSEEQLQSLSETADADLSKVYFMGQRAAVDAAKATVYVSQTHSEITDYGDLRGEFSFSDPSCALCIVETDVLNHIADCIKNGSALTMAVVQGNTYSKVSVVLTSLPVIRMDGSFQKYGETLDKDIMAGSVCLWTSDEAVSSLLQWHNRGAGALSRDKKAFKLSLKTDRETTRHSDLLGLGADDDWILNPMSLDDLRLREKMGISLWNKGFAHEDYNYPMSTGEYVELVCNDEYRGIYYLQRRVDQKYLQTDPENDIIFKGCIGIRQIAYVYDIKYSPYSDNTSFMYFDRVLQNLGENDNIHLENFVDVSLFLNYIAAEDNVTVTNMYYILRQAATEPQMFMIPWDADMAWGMVFYDTLDYEDVRTRVFIRDEYEPLKEKYPELDEMLSQRWFELREGVFSEENIKAELRDNAENIVSWDAAMRRDHEKWGLFHGGADSMEQFSSFCLERLEFLDEYYSKLISSDSAA